MTARRIPIFSTIIVLAAVATMIGLGVWQLGRAAEKDDRIAVLASRIQLPPLAYPPSGLGDEYHYRTLRADCTKVLSWEVAGGKDVNGQTGWSKIAFCQDAATGSRFKVNVGVGLGPRAYPRWSGGQVSGRGVFEPDNQSLFELVTRAERPRRLMIVSNEAAPGLTPSEQPDPADEKNSSWAYVGQWFFFALTALVIYGLALQRRGR